MWSTRDARQRQQGVTKTAFQTAGQQSRQQIRPDPGLLMVTAWSVPRYRPFDGAELAHDVSEPLVGAHRRDESAGFRLAPRANAHLPR